MKPLAEITVEPKDDPTVRDYDIPDPEGERIRGLSAARLQKLGFTFADNLPTAAHRARVPGKMRPAAEVARRLMALDAITTYVILPENMASTERVLAYVTRNQLETVMTDGERSILRMERSEASAEYRATIGWSFENMWALAWVLGFEEEPALNGAMITDGVIRAVVYDFLPGLDADVTSFVDQFEPRSQSAVVTLEDAFYCAHNSVRSAQTGVATAVPDGFDPIAGGGVIHERRHSLTWVLSPGVDWDDTDLST